MVWTSGPLAVCLSIGILDTKKRLIFIGRRSHSYIPLIAIIYSINQRMGSRDLVHVEQLSMQLRRKIWYWSVS